MVSKTRDQVDTACAHVVKIYDDDRDLTCGVSEFLAAGLGDGDAVIVVATLAHRQAFEWTLQRSAVDVVAATADGRYVAVDAEQLLAQFMVDGVPDPTRFRVVVAGELVRRAGGRPVRIFGEMVAVLWDEGNVTAAIALEALWNDLATGHDFSLYCAYAMASFASSSSDLASLRDVCNHHSGIVAPESYASTVSAFAERDGETTTSEFFVPAPLAIRAVRQFVRSALLAWGETDLLEDATLVASELATNAVRHARSPFRISISRVDGTIKLMVHDGSDAKAHPRVPTTDVEGGRGLALVGALCSSWGSETVPDGKIVWAELTRRV